MDKFSPSAIARKHFSEENLKRPPSRQELYTTLDAFAEALQNQKARITDLENGTVVGVKYLGVWQRQHDYLPGSLVTFKGGLWHANAESKGVEPGDGKAWTLSAKSGAKPTVRAKAIGRQL